MRTYTAVMFFSTVVFAFDTKCTYDVILFILIFNNIPTALWETFAGYSGLILPEHYWYNWLASQVANLCYLLASVCLTTIFSQLLSNSVLMTLIIWKTSDFPMSKAQIQSLVQLNLWHNDIDTGTNFTQLTNECKIFWIKNSVQQHTDKPHLY